MNTNVFLEEWFIRNKMSLFHYIPSINLDIKGLFPNMEEISIIEQIYCDTYYEGMNEDVVRLVEIMRKLNGVV